MFNAREVRGTSHRTHVHGEVAVLGKECGHDRGRGKERLKRVNLPSSTV